MTSPLIALLAAVIAPGFVIRVDASDAARYASPGSAGGTGIAVVFRTSERERSRVDLLVLDGERLPRWKWTDAAFVESGSVSLRAKAGTTALLVLRGGGAGYRLDGTFRWPHATGEREIVARPVRAVGGSSPFASPAHEIRLAGAAPGTDPLCESDGATAWQCAGLPRGFSGRVVACRGGRVAGAAEVHPDSPADALVRPVSLAVLFQVELPDPESSLPPLSVRALRPPGPKDFVARPDPGWTVSDLGDGLVWIEGRAEASEGLVEVRAPGYSAKRVPIRPSEARCAEPISVTLSRAVTVRGTVTDSEGEPVAGALVLVRSAEPEERAILGDGDTDAAGEFEVEGMEPEDHRVRACDGAHGCAEEVASPGVPVVLRLPRQGGFVGRVLSSAGVPQAGAAVRILPTAGDWATSDDRLKRLPLESRSGTDGRFRIAASENGDYLVEARTESSGLARIAVRRTDLSPAVTDLGDVRLPEPIEFTARLSGCGSGTLLLSGPLGGETSLPNLSRVPLDSGGSGRVLLPEGGAWTAWARCAGRTEWIEPSLLPDAAALAGLEVRFESAAERSTAGRP